MRLRDILFKRLKRTDESVKDLYEKVWNQFTTALRESKASYYYNYFQSNINNMKQQWTGIKSIINITTSDVNVITKIKESNGHVASKPAVIANFFNKFFVNVTKSIPRSRKSPLCFMGEKVDKSMFISPSVAVEITAIINLLKVGKSIGPTSIQLKF